MSVGKLVVLGLISDYTLNNGAGTIESFNFNPDSVIGGGNVGIQGQWANWVLGIEGTFN